MRAFRFSRPLGVGLLLALGGALLVLQACAHLARGDADTAPGPAPPAPSLHQQVPSRHDADPDDYVEALREAYARPPEHWPPPTLAEGVEHRELGPLPGPPPEPPGNPTTPAKAELGELLFFDGRLSGTGQMACASCHVAELGWADGRARSLGHGAGQLQRNTPSMLNAAYGEHLFWDGRASSLEALVVAVLTNEHEMAADPAQVEAAIAGIPGYAPLFQAAFGDSDVTLERIAAAIASHVRGIVSEPSADFDDFLEGEPDALSDAALRGLHLFRTDAGCLQCHGGPLLTDGAFHNLGLTYYGRKYEDLGRYRITGDIADVGAFKTPGLRNVARTAPYTHVGFFELPGLINIYNAGGSHPRQPDELVGDPLWPQTSPLLRKLGLDAGDKADLIAFLESLTERRRRDLVPDLPASEAGDAPAADPGNPRPRPASPAQPAGGA